MQSDGNLDNDTEPSYKLFLAPIIGSKAHSSVRGADVLCTKSNHHWPSRAEMIGLRTVKASLVGSTIEPCMRSMRV